jgi:hypothetical protein
MATKFAATNALIFAGTLLLAPAMLCTGASAQVLGYAPAPQSSFPSDNIMQAPNQPALTDEGDGSSSVLPERLRRTIVAYNTREPAGTVISGLVQQFLSGQRDQGGLRR